jgi:hypothetical protein
LDQLRRKEEARDAAVADEVERFGKVRDELAATVDVEERLDQLEVGFHAEHPNLDENVAVVAHLLAAESLWRPNVGDEA